MPVFSLGDAATQNYILSSKMSFQNVIHYNGHIVKCLDNTKSS